MFAFRSLALTGILFATTATLPAHAAGPFDGTYSGTLTPTTSGGAGCGNGGPSTKVIADGTLTARWLASDMRFSVGANGVIDDAKSMGSALVTIKGKVTGNVLSYDMGSQRCAFHFEGTKR